MRLLTYSLHLHFDHCGGGSFFNKKTNKMKYYLKTLNIGQIKIIGIGLNIRTQEKKASFLIENLEPIELSGQLIY